MSGCKNELLENALSGDSREDLFRAVLLLCGKEGTIFCSNAEPSAVSEFSVPREAGISSLNIYMTYEALLLKDSEILDVFFEARKQKGVTMILAENGTIID